MIKNTEIKLVKKKKKRRRRRRRLRKKRNLKMTVSMKVKAGVRLLTAEARVGELYSIPIYSDNRARNLPSGPT